MNVGELIIGLDIGGTKTAVVLGDDSGRIHERAQFSTPADDFEAALAETCTHIEQMQQAARRHGHAVAAISVSVGGPLDIEAGVIHSPPNLPGWDEAPLKQRLAERFGLDVYVQHDGNAGALAEWYFGAARGCRNVVFLTMGTGLGAGLILDGRVYAGTCDLAGEVGHIRLADDGPAAYGKAGSWEGFCGGAGILRLAALRRPERWANADTTVPTLADAARAGDAEARALFDEVGRRLGRGCALLVDLLNPEIIVVGSLAVRLGELILAPARAELTREALPAAAKACRLVPAELGERLGDVASLCAAIAAWRQSSVE